MPVSEIARQRNRLQNWIYIAGNFSSVKNDIIFLSVKDFNTKYGTNFANEQSFLGTIRRMYNYLGKSRHRLYGKTDKMYSNEIRDAYNLRRHPRYQKKTTAGPKKALQPPPYSTKVQQATNWLRITFYISSPPLNILVYHTGTFYPFSIDPVYMFLSYAPFMFNASIMQYQTQYILFYSTYTYEIENPVLGIVHSFVHTESTGLMIYQTFLRANAHKQTVDIVQEIFDFTLHTQHVNFMRNFSKNYEYYIYLKKQEFFIVLEGMN